MYCPSLFQSYFFLLTMISWTLNVLPLSFYNIPYQLPKFAVLQYTSIIVMISSVLSHNFLPFVFVFILRQGLILSSMLECTGMIITHCGLELPGSRDPLTSASCVPGTTGAGHHTQLVFLCYFQQRRGLLRTSLSLPKCFDYRYELPTWPLYLYVKLRLLSL